jgi:hypothetical protein
MAPFMKHELDRKYKKWRRGMSKKAGANSSSGAATGTKGSLKQQLRGKERLLGRLQQQQPQEGPAENAPELLDKLREEIQEIRQEMELKQTLEKERRNAVKSHGTRFLERQRLTRMERAIKVGRGHHVQSDKDCKMLQKIALDMVYVGYHPHDVKYQPLFCKGSRVVDDRRALIKRANTRRRILQEIKTLHDQGRRKVNWISLEQYQRLPQVDHWTVELERQFFGERAAGGSRAKDSSSADEGDDDRFKLGVNQKHAAILAAADQVEAELDMDLQVRADERDDLGSSDDSLPSEKCSTGSSDDDHDDEGLHLSSHSISGSNEEGKFTISRGKTTKRHKAKTKEAVQHNMAVNDSTETGRITPKSPFSDAASEPTNNKRAKGFHENDLEEESNNAKRDTDEEIDDDDFLVPAFDEDINAFTNPEKKPYNSLAGRTHDKSHGWETQRQRPGQFKRRKTRK